MSTVIELKLGEYFFRQRKQHEQSREEEQPDAAGVGGGR